MNVVFISPSFPPQWELFAAALRTEGIRVLGLGDTPHHELTPTLQQALDAYLHVDLGNYDAALRAVGALIGRWGRIDRVESLNEHWLELEAHLREDFNVPGPRPSDVRKMRRKSEMKAIFRSHGIPCGEGEPYRSPEQTRAFAARVGYPLVIKPDVGVGASRTFKVDDDAQLAAALTHPLEGHVVEKFIAGRMTSYDGLVDREGRLLYATSYVYSSGVMDIVTQGLDLHYWSRREIPAELERIGRKILDAYELRERFFHAEFFELPDGRFYALEINFRPPGGFTTDLVNYAGDADVYRLWARLLRGEDLSSYAYERKYHAVAVSRRFHRPYRVPYEELKSRLGSMLVLERPMPPVFAQAMGDWAFILRHENLDRLLEGIRWVEERP